MGFRFGLRFGPFSASTRIGGGGGGGSQGPGWDSLDEMTNFMIWFVICLAPLVWVWNNDDRKNILWWGLLQTLPFVVIFTTHFVIVNRIRYGLLLREYSYEQFFPRKPTMLTNALFALVGPAFYLLGFHTIPLAVRDRKSIIYETEVAITTSITSWLLVLIPALVFPETLFIKRYVRLRVMEVRAYKEKVRKQKAAWERNKEKREAELQRNKEKREKEIAAELQRNKDLIEALRRRVEQGETLNPPDYGDYTICAHCSHPISYPQWMLLRHRAENKCPSCSQKLAHMMPRKTSANAQPRVGNSNGSGHGQPSQMLRQTRRETEEASRIAASEKLGVEALKCPFCNVYIPSDSSLCPSCENDL